MDQLKINHDPEPIRLFKSDFLEFFSHITPTVVVLVWVPVVAFFLWRALSAWGERATPGGVAGGFVLGLFLWTMIEYTMHRFVFHYHPKGPFQERVFFLFHGVHHAQPQCKTRLVMPPAVSIPLALVVFGLVYLAFAVGLRLPHWVDPVMAGIIAGYLVYDLTHYATHHLAMRRGVLKALKRHHLKHHYNTPEMRYGVSSPLWDVVFRTLPRD
jgi:sterol desaturase/sphingolipid hydroxylase (fatty acid hydroxylase superfamily)